MSEKPLTTDDDLHRLPTDQDLNRLQRTTVLYYLHETNPDNGLVRDKTHPDIPCSIAAVGMALATAPVIVERRILPRDFMAKRQRQRMHPRFARAIMSIRMANARRLDAHEHILRPGRGHRNIVQFEGAIGLNKADGFHPEIIMCQKNPAVGNSIDERDSALRLRVSLFKCLENFVE